MYIEYLAWLVVLFSFLGHVLSVGHLHKKRSQCWEVSVKQIELKDFHVEFFFCDPNASKMGQMFTFEINIEISI